MAEENDLDQLRRISTRASAAAAAAASVAAYSQVLITLLDNIRLLFCRDGRLEAKFQKAAVLMKDFRVSLAGHLLMASTEVLGLRAKRSLGESAHPRDKRQKR
jgi:hypothetical protein